VVPHCQEQHTSQLHAYAADVIAAGIIELSAKAMIMTNGIKL